MYHFFVSPTQIGEKEIIIKGEDVNHIKNVLRMNTGEQISISSGQDNKEYRCEITEYDTNAVLTKIMWVEETGMELSSKIYLFQGLPKNDKMELIIQKAVELGVYEIIPVATRRAVVKLDAKKEEAKRKRWNSISTSAAKQSKRTVVPEVTRVMGFKEAVSYAGKLDIKLIPYELASGMEQTKEVINKIQKGQSIGIFIGPEGGFDESEVEAAKEAGAMPITLGKRILRTETAGMTVLSILMFTLED
ncbi:16S rRNA (uracil(1498)-N(3))-methyltransferase [uncultured Robinsoniella sp.]|uniref:16S rRNA (uracil(1498)-N(3))-methyltransferase n=1 Tax=uncultured Robinsoniella sp. TaxID=904190 RepID=UPI00374E4AEA